MTGPPSRAGAVARPPDQELVLPYSNAGRRAGQIVFVAVFFAVLGAGPLFGMYAWWRAAAGGPVCWPPLVWFGALGAANICLGVRGVIAMVVARRRTARGQGWLHLSSTGFEVHTGMRRPRRFQWYEIDSFVLVESLDDEGGVIPHVGLRYSAQRRRTFGGKLRRKSRVIDGHWGRSVDDAVDLMNAWLTRHRRSSTAASCSKVRIQPLWKFWNSSGGIRECSIDIRV
jgi:hypothetical protein